MGDPALSIVYNVTIDGFIPLGLWTKVEGLGIEYEVTEYREGGVNGYEHKIVGPREVHQPPAVPAGRLHLADAHDLAREQPDHGGPPDDGDHRHDRRGRGDHDLEPARARCP